MMMTYADDSTYIATSKSREENQTRVTEYLENIKVSLNSNKLCVNEL